MNREPNFTFLELCVARGLMIILHRLGKLQFITHCYENGDIGYIFFYDNGFISNLTDWDGAIQW